MKEKQIYDFLEGKLEAAQLQEFYSWLNQSDNNLQYFTEIKAIYNYLRQKNRLTEKEFQHELDRLNRAVDSDRSWFVRHVKSMLLIPAACILILIIGIHYWSTNTNLVQIQTLDGSMQEIVMEDGTNIILYPQSKLTYNSKSFLKNRTVSLVGEAQFDVSHNPAHPFIVNAPSIKIKVLGTIFSVSNYTDHDIAETILAEGSVELQNSEGDYLMTLIPGQKAVFQNKKLHVESTRTEDLMLLKYGIHTLRNVSIQEIVHHLEQDFHVRLKAVKFNSADSLYTISYLNDSNLQDVLDLLETISGSKFIKIK